MLKFFWMYIRLFAPPRANFKNEEASTILVLTSFFVGLAKSGIQVSSYASCDSFENGSELMFVTLEQGDAKTFLFC